MSFLEMASATLPDMTSGIISLWFRDPFKNKAPDADIWPLPAPPNTFSYADAHPFETLFWNAYGTPIPGFGRTLLYPALVTLPCPPPFQTDTMHMLLTFGNPGQSYDYPVWQMEHPGVLQFVNYTGSPMAGIGFNPEVWPAPYAPYFLYTGGDLGKYTVTNFKIAAPTERTSIVPQSFIGIDSGGYIRICLQTKTKANYTGYAYQLDEITNIMATATNLGPAPPPPSTGLPPLQIWPGYWDGYQFKHRDVSNQVMAAAPECFMIGSGPNNINDAGEGPRVSNGGWHHLLFSFDINGNVSEKQLESETDIISIAQFRTDCQAWLALDDVNYKASALQRAFPIPGSGLPLLPGQGGNIGGGFGTTHALPRRVFEAVGNSNIKPLGDNGIIPLNAWLCGATGTPRSGIVQTYITSAGISNGLAPYGSPAGDFQALNWTGLLATSYYGAAAVIPLVPPRPDIPNPMTHYDAPLYQAGPFVLPTAGFPIGIPAQGRHLVHNTGVELAELQIWANKTLDTKDERNRRLFLDWPKDAAGNPDKTKPLQPVLPNVAAVALGEPDILLHGTNNWKNGFNTGKAGYSTDRDGNKVLDKNGQFQPTAKIEKFLPEPKLGV